MIYSVFDNLESITPEVFSRLCSEISEQRREKVMRYKYESGRVQSLMAYITLKRLLKEQYSIDDNPVFEEGEHGKPRIIGLAETIDFNMSHCKNGVACAVNNEPVGIDIERIPDKVKEELCRYVFNEEEVEQVLSSTNPCVEFAKLWTMKEALVKLSGVGIRDKQQLRALLHDADKYNFHTEINEPRGWVMTVVSRCAELFI